MPIYEYICNDCGANYERIVLNDKSKVTCPKCASGKHTIKLSVFAARTNGDSKPSGGSAPSSGGGGCCGGACGCH